MAFINSKEHYDEYANSGYFTLVRTEGKDTKDEVLSILATHFKLENNSTMEKRSNSL